MKIKTKFLIILLPIILIPLIGVGLLSMVALHSTSQDIAGIADESKKSYKNRDIQARNIVSRFDEIVRGGYDLLARHISQSLEDICRSYEINLKELSASALLETYMNTSADHNKGTIEGQILSVFTAAINRYKLSEILLVNLKGQVLLQAKAKNGPGDEFSYQNGQSIESNFMDKSKASWFVKVKKGQHLISRAVYFDDDTQTSSARAVLSLASPLRYRQGAYDPEKGVTKGYLAFIMPVAMLCQKTFGESPQPDVEIFLTDMENRIVHHRRPDKLKTLFRSEITWFSDSLVFTRKILDDLLKLHIVASTLKKQGGEKIVADLAEDLKKEDTALYALSTRAAHKSITLIQNIILFILSTLIIASFLIVLLARNMTSSLSELSSTVDQIGKGNLNAAPEVSSKADEIVQLAEDINQMRLALKDQADKLNQTISTLKEDLKISSQELQKEASERKQAERKTQEINLAKSRFLTNMSHEIRTPMNAVNGFTEMLMDSGLDEQQLEYVTALKEGSGVLISLVNDILDFSKIEARQLDLLEIEFDPELLAYDVCELLEGQVGHKPIEIVCHIGDTVPHSLKGDPMRFRQVLTNLMRNALKFTEEGEIVLSFDVEEEDEERIKIHAWVRDTGIGFDADKKDELFEPFAQTDASGTRPYDGTGLGLAICKQIATLMKGEVWAESPAPKPNAKTSDQLSGKNSQEEPPGSAFHFIAWFNKVAEKKNLRVKHIKLAGKRALVVDDNLTNINVIKNILANVGIEVTASSDSREAISLLNKACEDNLPYDFCLSDLVMPNMDGYELAKKIRSGAKPVAEIPLVALSSLMQRDAEKCKQVGFDAFLSKPIKKDKLLQMLDRILGERESSPETSTETRKQIMTQYSVKEDMKHSVHILLVEDNIVNQKLAYRLLTKAGYDVEVATNGKEAVEMYTKKPDNYDLIFMDIQMPIMDGIEATEEIRKQGFTDIPIVAVTAHAMQKDRDRCLQAGMNDHISKPIDRKRVFETINKWVLLRHSQPS